MEFYVPSLKDIKVIKDALKDNHKRNCEMSPSNTVLWARHYKTKSHFGRVKSYTVPSGWERNIPILATY